MGKFCAYHFETQKYGIQFKKAFNWTKINHENLNNRKDWFFINLSYKHVNYTPVNYYFIEILDTFYFLNNFFWFYLEIFQSSFRIFVCIKTTLKETFVILNGFLYKLTIQKVLIKKFITHVWNYNNEVEKQKFTKKKR